MLGGAHHSNSRGATVAPLATTRADKRAELPSARSATPFRDDERNLPRGCRKMSDFARPGAGIDEPVPAGAAPSASAMPRKRGRGGGDADTGFDTASPQIRERSL